MTLLRMLAFRPVDGGVLTQSGGTGISPAPRPGNGMPSAPVRELLRQHRWHLQYLLKRRR
jgi:hypothetical protein